MGVKNLSADDLIEKQLFFNGLLAVLRLVDDPDGRVMLEGRLAAVRLAQRFPDSIPGFLRGLDESDPEVRSFTIWMMSRARVSHSVAVPALTRCLQDEHAGIRVSAAFELGRIGTDARSAIGALQKVAAEDVDLIVRNTAREAVKSIDPNVE